MHLTSSHNFTLSISISVDPFPPCIVKRSSHRRWFPYESDFSLARLTSEITSLFIEKLTKKVLLRSDILKDKCSAINLLISKYSSMNYNSQNRFEQFHLHLIRVQSRS